MLLDILKSDVYIVRHIQCRLSYQLVIKNSRFLTSHKNVAVCHKTRKTALSQYYGEVVSCKMKCFLLLLLSENQFTDTWKRITKTWYFKCHKMSPETDFRLHNVGGNWCTDVSQNAALAKGGTWPLLRQSCRRLSASIFWTTPPSTSRVFGQGQS